jgi:hypothetical protein
MSVPPTFARPRAADAVTFARAIREALTAREGQATDVEVVINPMTGKPEAAFALDCAAGRFVIGIAEREV